VLKKEDVSKLKMKWGTSGEALLNSRGRRTYPEDRNKGENGSRLLEAGGWGRNNSGYDTSGAGGD